MAHVNEACIPGLCYYVDIAPDATQDIDDHHGNKPLLVEINGPTHYQQPKNDDASNALTLVSEMKLRHLRSAGWHVAVIPFWQWGALTSDKAKESYQLRICSSQDSKYLYNALLYVQLVSMNIRYT